MGEEPDKPVKRMLLCDVYLGKSRTLRTGNGNFEPSRGLRRNKIWRLLGAKNYDSVRAPGGALGPVKVSEFVVYKEEQAIPRFIIEFERVSLTDQARHISNPAVPKRTRSDGSLSPARWLQSKVGATPTPSRAATPRRAAGAVRSTSAAPSGGQVAVQRSRTSTSDQSGGPKGPPKRARSV